MKTNQKHFFTSGLKIGLKTVRKPVALKGHSLIELLKGIALSASLALLAARMLVSCIKIN